MIVFKHTSLDGDTTEVTCSSPSLSDVIESFERFLKGSGYVFQGTLDFVEDENE